MTNNEIANASHDGRKGWIITLRAAAVCAVVLIHVISGWVGSVAWQGELSGMRLILDEVIAQVLIRWSVPCFVMITGALLLDPKRETGLDKVCRYIARMIGVLAVFGFGFCIIESVINNGNKLDAGVILSAFKNLLEGKSWEHMWYIYMLIGLYLLTPLLRSFTRTANDREMDFTLAVLFVFTVLLPMVNRVFHWGLYGFVPVSTCYVFYYLLGYRLSVKSTKPLTKRILLISGTAGFGITLLLRLKGVNTAINSENVFVSLYSAGIFSLCADNLTLERLSQNKTVRSVSKHSFGIYLFHPIFLNIFYKWLKIFPDMLPLAAGEALFWTVSIAAAYIMSAVLCKIRFFRKLIL